ncbi:MAG TPA: flagellar motor switch protein FliN [Polyangiaceae bacterium]|nr:flagellar motor switch protein FliN [Polyangiaceae bacterium]
MSEPSLRPSSPPPGLADGPVAPMAAPTAEASPPAAMRSIDSMGFVLDVPVELTIELGRKHARIGEILRLGPGSVLELSKANGEPLDVYVNNRLVARGEAVVVGEHYGIRLTEVLVVEENRPRGGS